MRSMNGSGSRPIASAARPRSVPHNLFPACEFWRNRGNLFPQLLFSRRNPLKESVMKLAAIAVTVMFATSPALAQGYGAAGSPSANPSAAQPATPATPIANSSNSTDDTRMAANQSKRHQHKKSSSTQDQSSNSNNTAKESPDASPQPSAQQ